jgi:hypothetical protein
VHEECQLSKKEVAMKFATSRANGLHFRCLAVLLAAVCAVHIQAQTGSLGDAHITSVSPISTAAYQRILIRGAHFGVNPPYNGCNEHLRITDVNTNWSVPAVGPFGGCQAGVLVTSWSDSEIEIEGFPSFQKGTDAFKIGDVIKIEVNNAAQGGPMSWISARVGEGESHAALPPAPAPTPTPHPRQEPATATTSVPAASEPDPDKARAKIVQALVKKQATSLELSVGKMYLYGMETGGGFSSSTFVDGQYAKVENADGKLSAALAYGTANRNSYDTRTGYHTIGGVSVGGSWEHFAAYYGSNHQRGAHEASVSFQTTEESLVIVFGLATSGQKVVGFDGIPGLEIDASGGGELIAHSYVKPGTFNIVEHSEVVAAGQDPAHMTNLVGIFVFGGKSAADEVATAAVPSAHGIDGSAKGNIHEIDFLNFEYSTTCLNENGPAVPVRVSKGQASNQDGQFWVDKPVYGDFEGDGHELAAVAVGCHPADMSPNVGFSEVLVFEMSEGGPKLLTKLPPSFWKQARVTGLKVSNQQLAADFLEMGMGSNACPEWVITSKLRWNGTSFVNAGESRRKNSCAR